MLNKNECSWIMWIDSDAIFTDHNRKIEEIIARYAPPTQNSWWGWSTEKHLLMPSDESGTVPWIKINNGVFLIKNSDWSHQFINSVAAKYSLYKNNGTPEQDAFQDLIFNHFPRDSFKAQNRSESDFSEWNLASEVALVPQRVMDSFYREPKYSDPAGANWRIGDFIAHLSGISAEDRLAGIRRIQEILRPFQEKN